MSDTLHILKEVVDNSSQLSAWALAVGAGTVAVIVSSSYHRPHSLIYRLPYLLFIPGWVSIGYSLSLGNKISSKYLASLMVNKDQIASIASNINDIFAEQQTYLFCSLIIFFIWLLTFTLTWLFTDELNNNGDK
ncbi:MAG: hypothetical protein KAU29_08135 [Gammaproteobacteria bacterium]|nr:hypothetical protein [Gammaproteobacteria bacterium]